MDARPSPLLPSFLTEEWRHFQRPLRALSVLPDGSAGRIAAVTHPIAAGRPKDLTGHWLALLQNLIHFPARDLDRYRFCELDGDDRRSWARLIVTLAMSPAELMRRLEGLEDVIRDHRPSDSPSRLKERLTARLATASEVAEIEALEWCGAADFQRSFCLSDRPVVRLDMSSPGGKRSGWVSLVATSPNRLFVAASDRGAQRRFLMTPVFVRRKRYNGAACRAAVSRAFAWDLQALRRGWPEGPEDSVRNPEGAHSIRASKLPVEVAL